MNKDTFRPIKLPGKTEFSNRRRSATRRAGFISHPDSTGGEFRIEQAETIRVDPGEVLTFTFDVPATDEEHFVGFGMWFYAPSYVQVRVEGAGISLAELERPEPNRGALKTLSERLEWFFSNFLQRAEHVRERDGKIAGELIVKALQKAINAAPADERFDLAAEYDRLRDS